MKGFAEELRSRVIAIFIQVITAAFLIVVIFLDILIR